MPVIKISMIISKKNTTCGCLRSVVLRIISNLTYWCFKRERWTLNVERWSCVVLSWKVVAHGACAHFSWIFKRKNDTATLTIQTHTYTTMNTNGRGRIPLGFNSFLIAELGTKQSASQEHTYSGITSSGNLCSSFIYESCVCK